MAKILFLISIMLLSCYITEQTKLSHYNTAEKKHKVTNTLKAEENVDQNSATEEYLMLLRTRGAEAAANSRMLYKTRDSRYVPDNGTYKEFDARKHWPRCKTIGEVLNNGNTKVSWAYANTGVFADRMCIATNGSYNQLLSTEELISCSGLKLECSYYGYISPLIVWEYFKSHGLVSGGKYLTNDGCQPSKIPPIGNIPTHLYTHACARHCYGDKTIDYNHDHVKVSQYYAIPYENIQKEVQAYGPVTAILDLHEDFFLYKSGVYARTKNSKFSRYLFAKLIGWGVENGVDYWLMVNSWGKEWGLDGLFKIKRGTNASGIEVYGGVPEIK